MGIQWFIFGVTLLGDLELPGSGGFSSEQDRCGTCPGGFPSSLPPFLSSLFIYLFERGEGRERVRH